MTRSTIRQSHRKEKRLRSFISLHTTRKVLFTDLNFLQNVIYIHYVSKHTKHSHTHNTPSTFKVYRIFFGLKYIVYTYSQVYCIIKSLLLPNILQQSCLIHPFAPFFFFFPIPTSSHITDVYSHRYLLDIKMLPAQKNIFSYIQSS